MIIKHIMRGPLTVDGDKKERVRIYQCDVAELKKFPPTEDEEMAIMLLIGPDFIGHPVEFSDTIYFMNDTGKTFETYHPQNDPFFSQFVKDEDPVESEFVDTSSYPLYPSGTFDSVTDEARRLIKSVKVPDDKEDQESP